MSMDGNFGKIAIGLGDLEEEGDVKLVAKGVNILRNMITSEHTAKDGWDIVLRQGTECWFCDLGIEP